MGNQQHRGIISLFQILNQIQHLCLNGNIQRCGRLIGNQKPRLACKSNGDDYTLLHTAGKLMGIFSAAGCGDTDQLQHLIRFFDSLFLGKLIMLQNNLHNLVSNGHNRIQGCHWILENHGNLFSSDLAHLLNTFFQQILSVIENLSALDFSRRIGHQLHNTLCKGGLACAGLSHQSQCLACMNLQADTV